MSTLPGPRGAPVLEADLGPSAHAIFTTRAGGVSAVPYEHLNLGGGVGDDPEAVAANRRIAAAALGAPITFAEQVHGTGVLHPGQEAGTADVVLGSDRGVGVLVADCVPVLLAAPGLVGAVHAGRRGLLAGVVQAAVDAMAAHGRPPTHAAIGPAICGRCYEVPANLRSEAMQVDGVLGSQTSWGTPSLDLPAGVRAVLERAGVGQIVGSDVCTLTDHRFYSHRRDGPRTGRFAALVRPITRDTPP